MYGDALSTFPLHVHLRAVPVRSPVAGRRHPGRQGGDSRRDREPSEGASSVGKTVELPSTRSPVTTARSRGGGATVLTDPARPRRPRELASLSLNGGPTSSPRRAVQIGNGTSHARHGRQRTSPPATQRDVTVSPSTTAENQRREVVLVDEPGRVFVARCGHSELTTTVLGSGQSADLVERMLRASGRRIDRARRSSTDKGTAFLRHRGRPVPEVLPHPR